jgi:predicted XRE-type DNA-binding protein
VARANRKRRASLPGVRNPFIRKQDLLAEIKRIVDARDMSQVEVADQTGEARSQVSLLLNAKLRGFSTDRLARILLRLGRDIQVVIRPSKRRTGSVSLVRR